ncbi:mycofactocin biosynthesis glycosyltransferase MftF [Nocardia sp. NPDC051030]|uniref:mycofactocin biosynthesis glycosyltransferase MftF n=1 Tax=Nocardia sp. NPDC051030 TaxID=3155162 RepID=UPI0034179085
MNTPLPIGFGIEFDSATISLGDSVWLGGTPKRVLRASAQGRALWQRWRGGPVDSRATGALARALTDAGIAHPVPPSPAVDRPEVTIVIPVRDRTALLAACLAAVGNRYPTLVVDDASHDRRAVAEIAAAYGAHIVHRPVNGGPGAARETGLASADTELIAFLDSDCQPPADWIDRLAPHFADPLVAAVAPRITPSAPDTPAGRYTRAHSALDLGPHPASVAPGRSVAYVPTAALLVRRTALRELAAADGTVFDPAMRVGEDVDLIWRLHRAGWRIRYAPEVSVAHQEPSGWRLLARRYRYGTSAGPLAQRHPGAVPPAVLPRWTLVGAAALLSGFPGLTAIAATAQLITAFRHARRAGIAPPIARRMAAAALLNSWYGLGRYVTRFAGPAVPILFLTPVPVALGASRRTARLAAAALVLGPILRDLLRDPGVDPLTFTLARLADDLAYGLGVWSGSVRARTTVPVRPVVI